jgi:glycosyltransferase involved in cell wall biosynthesis
MQILFAHNEYGAPSGEEQAVGSISRLLEAKGHTVFPLIRSSREIEGFGQKARAFFSGVYSFEARRQMANALDQHHPNLVQVQNLYPYLSPSIFKPCRQRGVPIVMRCPNYRLFCPSALHLSHGQVCERCLGGKEYWCVLQNCENDRFKSLGYALRNAVARITRSILDNISIFIVLSQFQKQRFIQAGIPADRLEILPNMVPQIAATGTEQPGDLVTFVGRASPEKGISDFVATARRLPDLPFAVAGAADRVPELVASSPPNVQWVGFLKQKELNQICLRSRILVFPFRWFEGFPNVLTQAMALQRPVLAARIGAVPEIVDDGRTGLLFDMGNVEDLVTKLRALYGDLPRCREMGAAGRAKAFSTYSSERVYTRLMEIYQRALTNAFC